MRIEFHKIPLFPLKTLKKMWLTAFLTISTYALDILFGSIRLLLIWQDALKNPPYQEQQQEAIEILLAFQKIAGCGFAIDSHVKLHSPALAVS